MTLDEFWDHIHKTRRKDPDAHVEKLVTRLAKLPPDEIVDFDHWWGTLAREAYHWNLWGAAYTINGGCSDDGFTDFRSWLMLQGRDVFQAAVTNPDTLADVVDGAEVDCECYPALDAWFAATGTEKDDDGYRTWAAACSTKHPERPRAPDLGASWDFDDLEEVRKRLPRLCALYLDGDTDA